MLNLFLEIVSNKQHNHSTSNGDFNSTEYSTVKCHNDAASQDVLRRLIGFIVLSIILALLNSVKFYHRVFQIHPWLCAKLLLRIFYLRAHPGIFKFSIRF